MKKLIIVLVVGLSFTSCQKYKQCYTCTVGNTNKEYCGDIKNFNPKDGQGNDVQFTCVPK